MYVVSGDRSQPVFSTWKPDSPSTLVRVLLLLGEMPVLPTQPPNHPTIHPQATSSTENKDSLRAPHLEMLA